MLVKNQHDAEDMTSSTFIKLMRFDGSFESPEHEKAWLIRAATNTCKDFLKSVWARRTAIPDNMEYKPVGGSGEVLEEVLSLPEKYKLPIYLHYYEGYSTAEIAKMLKMYESTVRGRLHRGRKLLKLELEGNYNEKKSLRNSI
jgi:RNA polymerase sigma-70 factor (ECF subfamily)